MIPHRPPDALRQKIKRDLNMGVLIAHCSLLVAIDSRGDTCRQYSALTLIIVLTFIEIEHSSKESIFALMCVRKASNMIVGR
jgi:hypothetical protein